MLFIIFSFFFLAIIAFIVKNNRFVNLLLFIIAVFLMGSVTGGADFENYEYRYSLSLPLSLLSTSDFGYSLICNFFHTRGYTFFEFRMILSFVSLFILFRFFGRYCYYYSSIAIVCYMLFYFAIDVIQIRNFLSFVVFLIGFPYLFKNTYKSKIIYSIFVLIATTIHASSVFYLLLILINAKRNVLLKTAIVASPILLMIFMSFLGSIESGTLDRIDAYAQSSILGSIFGISMLLLNSSYIYYETKRNRNEFNIYVDKHHTISIAKISTLILYVNIALLALSPFYFYNGLASRIFRFVSIINIFYLINVNYNRLNTLNTFILLIYFLYFFISFIVMKPGVIETPFIYNFYLN